MNKEAWKFYLRVYNKRDFLRLAWAIFLSMVQAFLLLLIPFLIRYIFDDVIPAQRIRILVVVGLVLFFIYLINSVISLWTRHIALCTTKTAIKRIREQILEKYYSLSHSFFNDTDRSRLHTVVVQDTERMDVMSNALVAQLIPSLFISGIISAVLIYLNWILFLLLLGFIPLLVLWNRVMGTRVRKRINAFHRSFERFSKGLFFVLRHMDLTRVQNARDFEVQRQKNNIDELFQVSRKKAWLYHAYSLIQSTTVASFVIFILVVGGRAVITGSMSLGELLSFFVAVALIRTHLHTISQCIPDILEGNESLATLYNLVSIQAPVPYSGRKKVPFNGKVSLDSVYFQYKENSSVLQGLNLTVEPHSLTAILGPNGVGKTTVVNLILGFYRPQKGRLYAGDYPYESLDLDHLRSSIGVVRQNPDIFPGTILENITYGFLDAESKQAVEEAAWTAAAEEFIRKLPLGYDTFVGENGVLLSGGQRQCVAIARALLRRPKLLILDEPGNNLDEKTVSRLMDNLKKLDPRPAVLIISHSQNILRNVQCIHVMKQGRIVSSGDFETLFNDNKDLEEFLQGG